MAYIKGATRGGTKTFHGWPYIVKTRYELNPRDKRKMTKKRRG